MTDKERPPGIGSPRKSHRMVDRVAALLEHVARSSAPLTLTELARAVDGPVSSIQGLVNGLVVTGYLDERDRRYVLGTAPYLLNLMADRRMITRVGHDVLESVHLRTGMTTLISVVVHNDVFYIDSCSREPRYDYLAKNFVRRSLIRTSAGWVLLADFSRRDLWAYLAGLPSEDDDRVEAFLAAMDAIRESGFCAAPGISEVADGVSMAVREEGLTVGALSVVGPREEVHARSAELVALLTEHRQAWESRR